MTESISTEQLVHLRNNLVQLFTEEELRTLCFELGLSYDQIDGDGTPSKARELVSLLQRIERIPDLIDLGQQLRPNADWAPPPEQEDTGATNAALDELDEATPPFKGLQFFDVVDADLFYGREKLTLALAERLHHQRFLAIVGASGSGKSSLARAGIVATLQRGEPLVPGKPLPRNCANWVYHILTPTARPIETLATHLSSNSDSVSATATLMDDLATDPRALHLFARKQVGDAADMRLVLLVDQFEELFTQCHNDAERKAFVDNLITATDKTLGGPTTVIITLRADFYAQCAHYSELRTRLEKYQEFIGTMEPEAMRRAIEAPAQKYGYTLEHGLTSLMLKDAGSEPGALPLLSHALLETWRRREGRTLTLRGYTLAGGLLGAIAQTADTVFAGLNLHEQATTRNIFLRLTELGEGAPDTRRRALLSELIPQNTPYDDGANLLKRLADARLIITNQDSAEMAHEALIREWPRLHQWLAENREALRVHRDITEDAHSWDKLGRDAGALYRGVRLGQANEWWSSHSLETTLLEQDFLRASNEATTREEEERQARQLRELQQAQALAEAERRRAQAATTRTVVAGVFSLIALVAALSAVWQGQVAEQQKTEAQKQEAIAQRQETIAKAQWLVAKGERTFYEGDPLQGLRLAMEGWALAPADKLDLRDTLKKSVSDLAAWGEVKIHTPTAYTIDAVYRYPDESHYILAYADKPGEIRRASDGSLVKELTGSLRSSAGEKAINFWGQLTSTMFTASYADGGSELWRAVDNTRVMTLAEATNQTKPVQKFSFDNDSSPTVMLVIYVNGTAELRRVADGQTLGLPITKTLKRYEDTAANEFQSQLGLTYASFIYADGSAEIRRARDGITVLSFNGPVDGPVADIRFSDFNSQNWISVHLKNGDVGIWNLPSRHRLKTFSKIRKVEFVPHSAYSFPRYFVALNTAELPVFYDLHTGQRSLQLKTIVEYDKLSYIGSELVVADYVKSAGQIIRAKNPIDVVDLPAEIRQVHKDDYLSSSGLLAPLFGISYENSTSELRKVSDGEILKSFPKRLNDFHAIRFSPDGTRVVLVFADFTVEVYDTKTGQPINRLSNKIGTTDFPGEVPRLGLSISPNLTQTMFAVSYSEGNSGELRSMSDGRFIANLTDVFVGDKNLVHSGMAPSGITYHPTPTATHFLISYKNAGTELRRMSDGKLIKKFEGKVTSIQPVAGSKDKLWWANTPAETSLWLLEDIENPVRLLNNLDATIGANDIVYLSDLKQLFVRYPDGLAYYFDITWLTQMGGDPDALGMEELMHLICTGPMARANFDESQLKPYLGDLPPQACRRWQS